MSYEERPWGWTFGWSAFAAGPAASFSLDTSITRNGRSSLRIVGPDSSSASTPHSIMLQVPAGFVRGKDIELKAWMRTAGARATASVAVEAWKDRAFAAADTAIYRSTLGGSSNGWAQPTIRIRVPADTLIHSFVITVALIGSDTAWFDDLTLSVNGEALGAIPSQAAAPTEAELAWLRTQSTPLLRANVSSETDDDLKPVRDIIGSARVAGLGESTHGTREFFQVKHRILQYLVREAGFRVFAIEANQLAVERINAFVQKGVGTASEVIRVMFSVWNTEEMLELIEWVRRYNVEHPERMLRFVGYDMQDHRTPVDTLRAYLSDVEPALTPSLERLTQGYSEQRGYATPSIEQSTRALWSTHAESLWALVSSRRADWLAGARTRADTLRAEWAVQAANLYRQAAYSNVALSSPERDSLMAANLDWVLRVLEPEARVVVWAHDVHVSHGGDPVLSFNRGAQMGAHVKAMGHDYRALSLLTYDGHYSATRSFSDHRMFDAKAFPAPPGSLEHALHRLGTAPGSVGWVVDLRAARTGAAGEWLRRPRPIRHIGYAAYDYAFELDAVLPLEFDGVVFIDQTTASRRLR